MKMSKEMAENILITYLEFIDQRLQDLIKLNNHLPSKTKALETIQGSSAYIDIKSIDDKWKELSDHIQEAKQDLIDGLGSDNVENSTSGLESLIKPVDINPLTTQVVEPMIKDHSGD